MLGRTSVQNDKDFVIQIIQKKFFFPIISQVFLKHPSGNEKSKGKLGNKIRQWEVLEKSRQTYKQTDKGHPQIIIWI